MEITLNFEEISAAITFIKDYDALNKKVLAEMLGAGEVEMEEAKAPDLFAIVNKMNNKAVSTAMTEKGISIIIQTEFVKDFIDIYGKAVARMVQPMMAMIHAVMEIGEDVEELQEKWFSKEDTEESNEEKEEE
jgi:hypothetical protein